MKKNVTNEKKCYKWKEKCYKWKEKYRNWKMGKIKKVEGKKNKKQKKCIMLEAKIVRSKQLVASFCRVEMGP